MERPVGATRGRTGRIVLRYLLARANRFLVGVVVIVAERALPRLAPGGQLLLQINGPSFYVG